MDRLTNVVQVCANISTIITTIMVGVLLSRSNIAVVEPTSQRVTRSTITQSVPLEGTTVSLSGEDWVKNGNTLLLVMSKTCHFCRDSSGFYKKIVDQAKSTKKVKLVAMMPHELNDSQVYLKEQGLEINKIVKAGPSTVGARGFPTLMLIDKSGKVQKSWVGKLDPGREGEVLKNIQCPNCG